MPYIKSNKIYTSLENIQKQEHLYLSSIISQYSESLIENPSVYQKNLIALLYDYYNAAKQHKETDVFCYIKRNYDNFIEINNHLEKFLDDLEEVIYSFESGESIISSELFDFISMNNMGHIMLHSDEYL